MHIAICDDNMADRKQLERLLKKEAQVYASESEPLYVDSYGNSDALLKSPMLYDVFLVDMCHGTTTGVDIYNNLRAYGVSAPVVLCSSLIRYQDKELPDDVLFWTNPLKRTNFLPSSPVHFP